MNRLHFQLGLSADPQTASRKCYGPKSASGELASPALLSRGAPSLRDLVDYALDRDYAGVDVAGEVGN